MYTHVVLLINFPEKFELYFYLNIQEVIKFYNLGDKTFDLDFNCSRIRFLLKRHNLALILDLLFKGFSTIGL